MWSSPFQRFVRTLSLADKLLAAICPHPHPTNTSRFPRLSQVGLLYCRLHFLSSAVSDSTQSSGTNKVLYFADFNRFIHDHDGAVSVSSMIFIFNNSNCSCANLRRKKRIPIYGWCMWVTFALLAAFSAAKDGFSLSTTQSVQCLPL